MSTLDVVAIKATEWGRNRKPGLVEALIAALLNIFFRW
jgi:hypothetical protein